MEKRALSTELDAEMVRHALALAEQGKGLVSPGPLVGCVIAEDSGEIIGEGFFVYDQVKHAETLALEQAGSRARGATAYVSLEPHAHFSKTPPCTDALIAAGIRRVVAPIEDPNPKVCGSGFDHLRAAGIEVCTGVMEHEARKLNEQYCHFMKTGRPFVHLKLAISLDGKIATRTGDSRWITGEEARARVHGLRHENDAILVGKGTAVADDPLLTDRSGRARRRQLVRVVLDETLEVSPQSQMANTTGEAPVIVFTSVNADSAKRSALESCGVEVINDPANGRDLLSILGELGSRSVQSVLVEGGAGIASKLLDARLVNKVTFFIAPLIIGGKDAPNAIAGRGAEKLADALQLVDVKIFQRGPDLEITGYPAVVKDEG